MKKYLRIQSNGEIETEAFTLIGASSKRDDSSKIGFFGSGLKYSIASMMRNNIDFKIFKGEMEIKFSVADINFRNNSYQAICVNGKETSMTTTMGGSDWDLAFAPFREIYSNALDEDSDVLLNTETNLIGKSGYTTFYIQLTKEMEDFYSNIENYFCDKNPNVLETNEYATLYPINANGFIRLFRKSILCYTDDSKSVFQYNSQKFDINESRVLSNLSGAKYSIAKALKLLKNKSLIKELLNKLQGGNYGYFEHTIYYDTSLVQFSEEWFEVCKDKMFVPAEMVMFCKPSQLLNRIILPKCLLIPLFRQFDSLDVLGLSDKEGKTNYIIEENPSEILTDKIVDALALLKKTSYKSRLNNIDISYCTFTEDYVFAEAVNGKILLSTKLDSWDLMALSKVIIEENEHNISNLYDETRAFQNHFINLYFEQLLRSENN